MKGSPERKVVLLANWAKESGKGGEGNGGWKGSILGTRGEVDEAPDDLVDVRICCDCSRQFRSKGSADCKRGHVHLFARYARSGGMGNDFWHRIV